MIGRSDWEKREQGTGRRPWKWRMNGRPAARRLREGQQSANLACGGGGCHWSLLKLVLGCRWTAPDLVMATGAAAVEQKRVFPPRGWWLNYNCIATKFARALAAKQIYCGDGRAAISRKFVERNGIWWLRVRRTYSHHAPRGKKLLFIFFVIINIYGASHLNVVGKELAYKKVGRWVRIITEWQ
jgi:hypothetical protein